LVTIIGHNAGAGYVRRANRTSIFKVRAALLERGLTLQEFADRNGFKYCTVVRVMRRHLGQEGTRPRGEKTLRILGALKGYAGHRHRSPSRVAGGQCSVVCAGCEVLETGEVVSSRSISPEGGEQ
jgi:predicted transcriptional regulator